MGIKILLHGCNGQMGQVISSVLDGEDKEAAISCGVDINPVTKFSYPVFSSLDHVNIPFDVIIDFSHASAVDSVMKFAAQKSSPLVIATTGLTNEQIRTYNDLSEHVPVFVSANMSLGINMLIKLVSQATKALYENFDIEIIEAHHRNKKDAPSGTALMIGDEIRETIMDINGDDYKYTYNRHEQDERRCKKEIGMSSIRGGSIPGDHKVIFAGDEEILEITHHAQSRNIFARGAIYAAKFICNMKPGLYNMEDILK